MLSSTQNLEGKPCLSRMPWVWLLSVWMRLADVAPQSLPHPVTSRVPCYSLVGATVIFQTLLTPGFSAFIHASR